MVDVGPFDPQLGKASAAFIMLCRNEEVDGAVKSIRELEDRFNHKYHYPWVFLNEVEFTEDFKKCARALYKVTSPTHQTDRFSGVSVW